MATVTNILKTIRLELHNLYHVLKVPSSEWERLGAVLSSPGWFCMKHICLDIIMITDEPFANYNELLDNLPHNTYFGSFVIPSFKFSVEKSRRTINDRNLDYNVRQRWFLNG